MDLTQLGTERLSGKRLIRVFPRRTKATPTDSLAYVGPPDLFAEADEVHVDCTFTADMPKAERLAEQWRVVTSNVRIDGVGWRTSAQPHGNVSLEFIPGRYVKHGYTFTSRGCPRTCWFCNVPKKWRAPHPILPLVAGWNVLDDNLLACPRAHVETVFAMLRRVSKEQRKRVEFTGGLEARALEDYQVGLLADLRPRPTCFFAYDPGDPLETLQAAARRLLAAGFTARSHDLRCYVLIGYPRDSVTLAEQRLQQMLQLGFTPFAMLWQPETPSAQKWAPGAEWRGLRRQWSRPALIHRRVAS